MKITYAIILLNLFLITSCEDLSNSSKNYLIARVDNNYLYLSDLDKLNLKFTSISDSIIKTQNYINTWAKKYILFDRSLQNIEEDDKNKLNDLIRQYELDLYNNSYKSSLIKAKIDTLITKKQISDYYQSNSFIFKLKEPLYKYRYIEFPKNNIDRNEITKRFISYSHEDKYFLDSLTFQFSNSFLNDSIWFSKKAVLKNVKFLNSKNLLSIKKSEIFEVEETIQVYLIKIENYLPKNEIAPLSFVENTIRNIVFNQRKLKFLKNFDQELINDAIQNKKFEIYN